MLRLILIAFVLLLFTVGAVAATTLVFAIVELGQFFLPSRSPSPTDVILGVIGAYLGLRVGGWVDWTAWPSLTQASTREREGP